jgi:hypothetical protein
MQQQQQQQQQLITNRPRKKPKEPAIIFGSIDDGITISAPNMIVDCVVGGEVAVVVVVVAI